MCRHASAWSRLPDMATPFESKVSIPVADRVREKVERHGRSHRSKHAFHRSFDLPLRRRAQRFELDQRRALRACAQHDLPVANEHGATALWPGDRR